MKQWKPQTENDRNEMLKEKAINLELFRQKHTSNNEGEIRTFWDKQQIYIKMLKYVRLRRSYTRWKPRFAGRNEDPCWNPNWNVRFRDNEDLIRHWLGDKRGGKCAGHGGKACAKALRKKTDLSLLRTRRKEGRTREGWSKGNSLGNGEIQQAPGREGHLRLVCY